MVLNEIEFVGYDRYFKYRYANETTINCSTPDIPRQWTFFADLMESLKFKTEYLKRFLNIKLDFEGNYIDLDEFDELYKVPNFYKKSHIAATTWSSSSFRTRLDHFNPSPPVGISKLIIVSTPQLTVTSTFWSFLNMNTEVLILIVLTLLLLSILRVIHSIVTKNYKSVPPKKFVKKMAQETLENVWENATLLCSESIPTILPHITCRLLASSWLIGVTFILFFLGCYLRTDFSTESYNCIDTLSDLIKSGIEPAFITEGSFKSFQDLVALDPVAKKWLDAFDEEKLVDFFQDGLIASYIPIFTGKKALIIDADLIITFLKDFRHEPSVKEFFVRKGGFYFSQQVLKFNYEHFIFNTSWIRSIPQLNAQLMVEPTFEKKVLKYQDLATDYYIDQLTWKRPFQSTEALYLSSVSVPFYFLLMLLSGTVAVVFTEIFFY